MLNVCQHKDILYHTVLFFSIIDFVIICVSYSSTMINMYVCFIFHIAIINYSYIYVCMNAYCSKASYIISLLCSSRIVCSVTHTLFHSHIIIHCCSYHHYLL